MKQFYTLLALLGSFWMTAAEIKTSPDASVAEYKAAAELSGYLEKLGGTDAIFELVKDSGLEREQWRIASIPGGVRLSGGSDTGILYAVYHYLEKVCGVRWWNPFEETVPALTQIPVENLQLQGKPAFAIRDIYSVYGSDDGRFSARSRLNGDGDARIVPEYGGRKIFGPPYFCHTFGMYIPPEKYFKDHPEWFAMLDGKRHAGKGTAEEGSQLCLSNKELRREIIKRLYEFIRLGEEKAKKEGMPPPLVYDISQNDSQRYCRCPDCQAVVDREGGAQSGLMIDFINEIADAVKKDHPEITLTTFAYQYTEKPPLHIRPRPNVMIVLCDTLSNSTRPLGQKYNPYFADLLQEWSQRTDKLRIWDYAVTYQSPNELPYASEYCYRDDMKLFRQYGAKQVFTELEYPVTADVRDYKVYLRARLTENPDLDFKTLSEEFAAGFYGVAGPYFLAWRQLLAEVQDRKNPYINMYPGPNAFTHLTLDVVVRGQQLFDQGEAALANDEVKLKRWRHARLSLDRASLIRSKNLMAEYLKDHPTLEKYPLDREKIATRIRRTWTEQAQLRLKDKEYTKSIQEMEKELEKYSAPINPKTLTVPEKFRQIPAEKLFDYTMENSKRWRNTVKLVDDPEAETGLAACLEFPNDDPGTVLEKYQFPLLFGIYSPAAQKNLWARQLQKQSVPGPGYHWYNLGKAKLSADCYLFCFWSWYIQVETADGFDLNHPDQQFDVWLRLKFTGPAYPHGKASAKNGIWLERVVLIRN